jgi:hypothetical protein
MENATSFVVVRDVSKGVTGAPKNLLIALRGSLNFGPSIASIEVKSQNTGRSL